MTNWLDRKFEGYAITDAADQWSPAYVSARDKFLSSLCQRDVSSVNRWKFYILRVERRLRYMEAKHQPFRKLSGEDLVTLQAILSTLISLRDSKIPELHTKTALIDHVARTSLASTGTARTWVEALLQKGVLKELTDPVITSDKRKKFLYASAATRIEFYKDCINEMLNHISGVKKLFGENSLQFRKEIELFAAYDVLSPEEIFEFTSLNNPPD